MTYYTSTILCKAFILYNVYTDNIMDFFLNSKYCIIINVFLISICDVTKWIRLDTQLNILSTHITPEMVFV